MGGEYQTMALEGSAIKDFIFSFRFNRNLPQHWRIFMTVNGALLNSNYFHFFLFNEVRFILRESIATLISCTFSMADVLGSQSFFLKTFSIMEKLLILINEYLYFLTPLPNNGTEMAQQSRCKSLTINWFFFHFNKTSPSLTVKPSLDSLLCHCLHIENKENNRVLFLPLASVVFVSSVWWWESVFSSGASWWFVFVQESFVSGVLWQEFCIQLCCRSWNGDNSDFLFCSPTPWRWLTKGKRGSGNSWAFPQWCGNQTVLGLLTSLFISSH